jgi:CheY-like chemotaxis protein
VDDEPDVAELFRQRFRRETRQGMYVLHYAASAAEALDQLVGEIEPSLVAALSDISRHRREFALNALVTELICRPASPHAVAGRKGPTIQLRRKFKR